MMDRKVIMKRLAALRREMKTEGIDYYLVFTSDFHQSEYLDDYFKTREFISGFTGSAGWMVISDQKAILWTDGRYFVQARMELAGTKIELYRHGLPDTPTILKYLASEVKSKDTVACDGRTIGESFRRNLQKAIGNAVLKTDVDLFDRIWTHRPAMSAGTLLELPITITGRSRADKLDFVRKRIAEKQADAYLLNELSAIMWLFNLRGNDIECNPVAFSYAYINQKEAVLFVREQAVGSAVMQALRKDQVRVLPYPSVISFLSQCRDQCICADPDHLNSSLYEAANQFNTMKSICDDDFVPKYIKNETEISLATHYHVLDAVAMIRFIRYIKTAVQTKTLTEADAAHYIDRFRSQNEGFVELSFPTICAYGENAAIIHYEPAAEHAATLAPKGLLLLDSGAQYLGATTDVTRTIALGELTIEERQHFTLVLKALIRLASVTFLKGVTGANLDILARGVIWDRLIDYRHGTGHGIGAFLNVHEGPQNIRYHVAGTSKEIEPGMITSNEPGIYIEGSHGIRTENAMLCVPVAENEWGTFYGFQTLTLVPIDLEAIDSALLTRDEINWLNAYHATIYETVSPYLNEEEKHWLQSHTHAL